MGQKHLTKTHRETIERLLGEKSLRSIADLLGYSPAAISKEVRRNANKNGRYDAQAAQRLADWRASKDRLRSYWSPEQIAGRLRQEFPEDTVCVNFRLAICPQAKCSLPVLLPLGRNKYILINMHKL